MAEICSCTSGISNFGQPVCVDSFGADARLVFVQYYDNLGAVNSIKSTDTLDETFIQSLVNAGNYGSALDISKRWYLTENINTVEGERAEAIKQEVDGVNFIVKQGVRNYKGAFYKGIASPKYAGALKSIGCLKMGYYIIDVNGSYIGMRQQNEDGTVDLNPIKIQNGTFDALYKYPSKTEVQSVSIMFDVDENEKDENLSQIKASEFSVDLLALRSVATVNGEVSTALATTFTLVVAYDYGTAFTNQPLVGLDNTNIIAYNVTDSSAITILSVVESPNGTYLCTIAAPTTADVISVNIDVDGFEMKEVTYTSL